MVTWPEIEDRVMARIGREMPVHKALGESFNQRFGSLGGDDPAVNQDLLGALQEIGSAQKVDIAVVQVDIVGSTAYTNDNELAHVQRMLNLFIPAVADVTYACGGAVDKYPGDAVMSFFGLHKEDEISKAKITRAIIAACSSLYVTHVQVNPILKQEGIPIVACKAGVASGPCVVAHVGTPLHAELMAIGNAPNLAAKLEKQASPWQVLVEKATLDGSRRDPVMRLQKTLHGRGQTGTHYVLKWDEIQWVVNHLK